MTTTFIELSEDAFDALFPLRPNYLNPTASWCVNDVGCLFDTFGPELEFVRTQHPRSIWTMIDGDDGQYVVSGMHFVNRIGYLISMAPLPEDVDVQVRLDVFEQVGGDDEAL